MLPDTFSTALAWLLRPDVEGGEVNHPAGIQQHGVWAYRHWINGSGFTEYVLPERP